MPVRKRVSIDKVPGNNAGRKKNPASRMIADTLGEVVAERELETLPKGESLYIEFSASEEPAFRFSSASKDNIKDRCRRQFRREMTYAGLGGAETWGCRYQYMIEQASTGEYVCLGYGVWIYLNDGSAAPAPSPAPAPTPEQVTP